MKRLIAAAAILPALLTTGAFAQSVTDEVNMQLWCGTAFTIAFGGEPPEELSDEEVAQGKAFFDGGIQLIALAELAHLDAGFTQVVPRSRMAREGAAVVERLLAAPGGPS